MVGWIASYFLLHVRRTLWRSLTEELSTFADLFWREQLRNYNDDEMKKEKKNICTPVENNNDEVGGHNLRPTTTTPPPLSVRKKIYKKQS